MFIGYEGGTYLGVMANGPGITGYADCFQFPERSTLTTTASYADIGGSPSVTLRATTSYCRNGGGPSILTRAPQDYEQTRRLAAIARRR